MLDLDAAEAALRDWNRTAIPSAENFRKYASRLEIIVAKKAAARMVSKKQVAAYRLEIYTYKSNAEALENLKELE